MLLKIFSIPHMTDIYCDVIDNYGDIAFAIKLINTYVAEKKEKKFRFFCNNKILYDRFSKNISPEAIIHYISLENITLTPPASKIINLFERKIDYTFLESFDFPIYLIHFSYFSLEPYKSPLSPGIQAWHGKISEHKNLTIENF